jgi:hypothetical protein
MLYGVTPFVCRDGRTIAEAGRLSRAPKPGAGQACPVVSMK